jgi:zinc transport system permease protein
LLVLPVAAVQQVARSFRTTFYGGMALGALVTTTGLVVAYYSGHFPAATIVLMSIGLFVVASLVRPLVRAG